MEPKETADVGPHSIPLKPFKMPLKKILEDLRFKGQDPEELTLLAIEKYKEDEATKKAGNDAFEKFREAEEELAKNLEGVTPELKELAIRIDRCSRHGFFVIRVAELKILYLLRALKHDLEDRNPLSLASNTRGLVEHTAAMSYAGSALEQLLKALDNQSSEARINQALKKAEITIESCFYGSSPKGSDPEKPKAPHINDCLNVLKEQPGLDEIGDIYGYLCEFVHPNYGSNTLVSTGIIGEGLLDPPPEYHKEAIQTFCTGCVLCLSYLLEVLSPRYSIACIRLGDLVHRCVSPGARITNVFSVREPSTSSDGTTKETAIFFSKARTHFEAMEMTYKYMNSKGINTDGLMRHIDEFGERFFYEYWDTPEGKIWFKFDMKKASFGFSGESGEANVAPESVKMDQPKAGRNDPCPCGSGKKFKKCCGA